ncbi:hypothetical protein [Allorhodopirellula solitaria]|uniref:Secreted protein n=1 Tax=Allorhodopirellula solitaria TaxID=2527987 RepID=A0A5C5WMF3_9BACT|nr:hypothetical protein [Allorhodopirellula solitaria]TWT51798.1 hypothetical protein CA85_51850 [Allorhodopirellula solitaria]
MLSKRLFAFFCAGFLAVVTQMGCGPDNSATVSDVDDSVVHTEEEMEEMGSQNAADMNSQ